MSNIFIDKGRLPVNFDEDTRDIIETIRDVDGILITEDERMYVHHIVSGLKGIGVWTKIKALYGFVGGTAATHKWNWKDMRDLDDAFRLTFEGGGWVHSSTGAKPNGTSSYADTYFNLVNQIGSVNFNNVHLSVQTNSGTFGKGIDIGSSVGTPFFTLSISRGGAATNNPSTDYTPIGRLIGLNPNVKSYIIANSKDNKFSLIHNTVLYSATLPNTASNPFPNFNLYLAAIKNQYLITDYTDRQLIFSTIGYGLTDQEAIQMSHIITTAQGILGRK